MSASGSGSLAVSSTFGTRSKRGSPRRPLSLVLQKDLDGAAAERMTALEGQMQSARDRHMSTEVVGP